jgi:hypothetical protein
VYVFVQAAMLDGNCNFVEAEHVVDMIMHMTAGDSTRKTNGCQWIIDVDKPGIGWAQRQLCLVGVRKLIGFSYSRNPITADVELFWNPWHE